MTSSIHVCQQVMARRNHKMFAPEACIRASPALKHSWSACRWWAVLIRCWMS